MFMCSPWDATIIWYEKEREKVAEDLFEIRNRRTQSRNPSQVVKEGNRPSETRGRLSTWYNM